MKRLFFCFLLLLVVAGSAFAQEGIESGDTEISFAGTYFTLVGTDIEISVGNFMLSYGKYLTAKLLLGIAPGLTISTTEGESGAETETDMSLSGFFSYNFVTNSKTIPYVKGAFYQQSFDIPDNQEFSDYSYIQGGLGLKNFFNEFAFLDTSISYGYSLAENAEGGMVMVMTAISVIF